MNDNRNRQARKTHEGKRARGENGYPGSEMTICSFRSVLKAGTLS
jgi:hypothetical protein